MSDGRAAPAALFPAWLRAEVAASPGRWRYAAVVAATSTAALALALALQFGSFPAPLMAFKAALPNIVCTWRTLLLRLVAIWASAAFAVTVGGFLVQLPWLLLPAFFAIVTVIVYLVPINHYPVAGYALALTLAASLYSGIYDPLALGPSALSLAVGFSIGIATATFVAEMRALPDPRGRLEESLASTVARVRQRVREAGRRFRTGEAASEPAEPIASLAAHLQLLELVQQETADPSKLHGLVTLITVAERAALFAGAADAASREPRAPGAGAALDTEVVALLDAVDVALLRFEDASRHPDIVGVAAPEADAPWPDFPALLAALHRRREAPVAELWGSGIREAAAMNDFLQALDGLADVLHSAPAALEFDPSEAGRLKRAHFLPPFDPFALLFAARVALACVIGLVIGVTSHRPQLETIVLNPLILAQGSYGASIRKGGLRLAGVTAGGIVAILVAIAVMVNTDNVGVWLLVFFLIQVPFAYLALGSPKISYFGLQAAVTLMIVIVANQPIVDVHVALWRFLGTVLGALTLFGVFSFMVPDYAGRQLVSAFRAAMRSLLDVVPRPGQAIPPLAQTHALSDRFAADLSTALRLAEESRWEAGGSGVDPAAALNAVGMLRRIWHRWSLLRHARRSAARPPLPPAAEAALVALEGALRTRLTTLFQMLEARHHRSRPGSPAHRRACAAAQSIAARERPDVQTPFDAFVAAVDAARATELRTWTTDALQSLLAEIGHLRRLVDLMPRLEAQLLAAVVPG